MTASEAIKILKKDSCYECSQGTDSPFNCEYLECRVAKATRVAIQALEKQIPKKPIMKQYFEDLEDEYLCCPTCGEILTDRIPADNKTFYFHCMNCGQKFDWSDEE